MDIKAKYALPRFKHPSPGESTSIKGKGHRKALMYLAIALCGINTAVLAVNYAASRSVAPAPQDERSVTVATGLIERGGSTPASARVSSEPAPPPAPERQAPPPAPPAGEPMAGVQEALVGPPVPAVQSSVPSDRPAALPPDEPVAEVQEETPVGPAPGEQAEPQDYSLILPPTELVASIQQALRGMGYRPGPADGMLGPRTRDAIASYQRRHGLPVTAEPSEELLLHLRGQTKAPASSAGFATFQEEANRATMTLGCPEPRNNAASGDQGALYGCIAGGSKTVKWFINEDPRQPGQVSNVKLIWSEQRPKAGQGERVDQDEAARFVDALAELYGPELKDQLLEVFFANRSATLESSLFRFAYSYARGPTMDRRSIVVTEKP